MRNVLRVNLALVALVALFTLAQASFPPDTEFTNDGCTFWFDGDWWECCEAHDLDYWLGGSYADRVVSDAKLQRCISRKGHPVMAWLMHAFVRPLGACWIPWAHRWGAGWNWPQCGPR